MTIRFTKAARKDLQTIYLQGDEMFGRKQAEAYAQGLAAVFRLIAEYPQSSRLRHETTRPVRARPYRSHVILYAVEEGEVLILRVRHGHEDWQADTFTSVDHDGNEP